MELLILYILFYGGMVGLVLIVGNKIIKMISMVFKGYKTVSGEVIDYIDINILLPKKRDYPKKIQMPTM